MTAKCLSESPILSANLISILMLSGKLTVWLMGWIEIFLIISASFGRVSFSICWSDCIAVTDPQSIFPSLYTQYLSADDLTTGRMAFFCSLRDKMFASMFTICAARFAILCSSGGCSAFKNCSWSWNWINLSVWRSIELWICTYNVRHVSSEHLGKVSQSRRHHVLT